MSGYFADASGTEKSDALGVMEEIVADEIMAAKVKAIADEIAHPDQLSIWSEEMQCRPDLEEFLAYTGVDNDYESGLECHHACQAAIRELAEKVIERILANPALVQR